MRTERASEQIRGQVERVDVRKPDGGWGTAQLRAGTGDGHVVTITGTVQGVMPGSTVDVRGAWEEHPRWGRRFKATSIEVVIPDSAGGAISWLVANLPGIGRKRAAELVDRFGIPGLWTTIESDARALTAISGITDKGVVAIVDAYQRTKSDREDSICLRDWGLGEWAIKAVREVWGARAVAELQKNPYQLIEKVRGFGFVRADEVARRMGVPADSPFRIQAALVHLLDQAEQDGHCFVPGGKLVAFAAQLLGAGIPEPTIAGQLVALQAGDEPKIVRDGTRCYRPETHEAEIGVAHAVGELLGWSGASSVARAVVAAPATKPSAPNVASALDDGDWDSLLASAEARA